MLSDALQFLLNTIFGILAGAFLCRFWMQFFRVSFQNPFAKMLMTLTDFAVKPVRKWLPALKKIDLSTLLLGYLTVLIMQILLQLLQNHLQLSTTHGGLLALLAGLGVIKISLEIFFYAILASVILSWVAPQSPIAPMLNQFTAPLLKPIRRFIPVVNGIDFAPLVFILLLQMLNITIISALEKRLETVF